MIEKNKVDIYDIPISIIADQYLDYVALMQEMDLDVASGFLVMASTLLHIKSRMLLPAPRGGETDGSDPRDALVVSMIEYKKYKEFSASLREKAAYWGDAYFRTSVDMKRQNVNAEQLSLFDMDRGRLLSVYRGIVDANRRRHDNVVGKVRKIIEREKVTLSLKIREIAGLLTRRRRFLFQKIYNPALATKNEIVTGFAAILELSRQERVSLRQKRQFGGLLVSRRERK